MDPITLSLLIGGASTLGGMFFNGQAQDDVNSARNGVVQQSRGDQAALDAEAKGVTDQSLGRFKNFGQTQSADASRLADFYKTPAAPPSSPYNVAALPPSTNDIVNREIATKKGVADAYVNHQADTLGNLRSFGDVMGNISRGQAADTQHIGQIGSFKAGDTGVTNIALDNANRAGNTNAMLGNLFTGAGKVALTAGLSPTMAPGINPDGSIMGALGPTSVGGKPLVI
jgi:hypothetical protein